MLIELFGGPLDGEQFEHIADIESEILEDPRIFIEGTTFSGEVEVMLYTYKGGGFAAYQGHVEFDREH